MLARNLTPGTTVDIPADLVAGTDNEVIAEYEYACIEQVNGGWLDAAAEANQVVLYTDNFALPILLDGDTDLQVINTETD